MKMIGLLGLLTLVAASQIQAAPAFCSAKNSEYAITLSNNHRTAKVTVNGEEVPFGHLECRSSRNEGAVGEAFLYCQSPKVADAGFAATFHHSGEFLRSTVKLEEFWFGGTHDLGTLTCIHAMN